MKVSFSSIPFKHYIFSFIVALVMSVAISGIAAIIFSVLSPAANIIKTVSRIIAYLPIFISAFLCGKSSDKNGFLTGIICGNICMLTIIAVGMIIFKNSFPADSAFKIFSISTSIGGVAGIMGINFKK